MENKSYVAVVLTLFALIGVALWQFYSLVRADALDSRYTVGVPGGSDGMNQRPTPAAKPR